MAFSFQVKIEGISSLLTQLVMPSGGITHRPVPSPSKQGSSCRLVSIPMTGDKESSEITCCNVQLQLLVEVVEGGHMSPPRLLYIQLVAVPLLEL